MKTAFLTLCVCAFIAGCDNACHDHGHDHGHENHKHGGCSHDHGDKVHEHGDKAHEHDPGHENHGHDGCSHEHEKSGPSCPSHGSTHEAKSVKVSKAIQEIMALKTVKAEMRRVSSTLVCPGRYELLPDARQTVATPVAGRLSISVKPLAVVRKGDVLFSVSSPDLVARAREISILEKRLAVYKEIKTRNAALENELAVKRAERAALIALADEKDGVVTVRAASDGLVEEFAASNGDWLETGAGVIRIVDPKALRLKALVPAGDAARLKDGLIARVGTADGEVRIGVGDDSGLVPVYVVFRDLPNGAIAGKRDEAVVETDAAEAPHPALPSRCIVRIGLQPTVFVRDAHDAERFIALPVTPVRSGGGWTAVEGEIPDGARVVSDGVYELKLALPGGESKSSGHFHADGTFHEGEH